MPLFPKKKGGIIITKHKNIVLVGPPKSGKTTLAKMIIKEIGGYSYISHENVRTAFLEASCIQKEEGRVDVDMNDFSFLNLLAYCYFKHSKYYESDLAYVVEIFEFDEELIKLYKDEDCVFIFLTYSDLKTDEFYENIRKYAKENDWTTIEPSYRLKSYCETFIEENKDYADYAKKNNMWQVDVSKNKLQVLKDTLEKIKDVCTYEE